MEKNDIMEIAQRLRERGNPVGDRLMRLASAVRSAQMGPGFAEYASEPKFNESGDAPPIESFVRHDPGGVTKLHQATVGFIAPDGVSEADIMEFILGIGEALGVKVESFKWSVTDNNKKKQ
jgi:hypothetical protein